MTDDHGHDARVPDKNVTGSDCSAETDCSDVIALVYAYLDGEMREEDRIQVGLHLSKCGPCLRQYGLEEVVKELVHRSCSCPVAPEGLRMRIVTRIQQVRITYTDI